jgi:hypothetical protein
MKEVGKRNVRSQGRADLFCVDTSQKQTILFRSPTSHYWGPYSRIEDYGLKCGNKKGRVTPPWPLTIKY